MLCTVEKYLRAGLETLSDRHPILGLLVGLGMIPLTMLLAVALFASAAAVTITLAGWL